MQHARCGITPTPPDAKVLKTALGAAAYVLHAHLTLALALALTPTLVLTLTPALAPTLAIAPTLSLALTLGAALAPRQHPRTRARAAGLINYVPNLQFPY